MGKRLAAIRGRIKVRNEKIVTPYELFIAAVTILSLVNIALYFFIKNEAFLITLEGINYLISGLFFIDFLRRFISAEDKKAYFFRDFGWADLLASFPHTVSSILRIFRLIKTIRVLRRDGFQTIVRGFNKNIASAAILLVFFIIILLLEFGSVGILVLEMNAPGANITNASDAMWWVIVTIATVGYGDQYPVTNNGRIFASFVMIVGVGLFGVVTGFLANKFLPQTNGKQSQDEAASIEKLQKELQEIKTLLTQQQSNKNK